MGNHLNRVFTSQAEQDNKPRKVYTASPRFAQRGGVALIVAMLLLAAITGVPAVAAVPQMALAVIGAIIWAGGYIREAIEQKGHEGR